MHNFENRFGKLTLGVAYAIKRWGPDAYELCQQMGTWRYLKLPLRDLLNAKHLQLEYPHCPNVIREQYCVVV
jgi:hypothetical protein